ncbi:hypothetical protein N7516_002647 [Penicillium verrucosum]|uniref:uncharacterized protein n=1 Tax=Penicillium verrucosum TaxID=60171 RepID=UPI0025454A9D|nr:uncharacterized protein N7516_002647 [Penicillium verrucosum]KAJ5942479.1 hypothetical protein N7516_002647 [Penicillium verrucosum]
MSAAKAFPVGENPSPNDYFARFAAFLDRLLADLTPSETKAFLWDLLGIHYPLPNPAPAAAQGEY